MISGKKRKRQAVIGGLSADHFRPKQRARYSVVQTAELEEEYKKMSFPTKETRERLSKKFQVSVGSILIWFQNRRSKSRRAGKVIKRTQSSGRVNPIISRTSSPKRNLSSQFTKIMVKKPPEHILRETVFSRNNQSESLEESLIVKRISDEHTDKTPIFFPFDLDEDYLDDDEFDDSTSSFPIPEVILMRRKCFPCYGMIIASSNTFLVPNRQKGVPSQLERIYIWTNPKKNCLDFHLEIKGLRKTIFRLFPGDIGRMSNQIIKGSKSYLAGVNKVEFLLRRQCLIIRDDGGVDPVKKMRKFSILLDRGEGDEFIRDITSHFPEGVCYTNHHHLSKL